MAATSELAFVDCVDTPAGRWAALRRFVTVWGGATLSPTSASELKLADSEKIAGRPLPFSLCEAIVFNAELEASTGWGSGYDLQMRADLEALLLGNYCDDDWYIGIFKGDMDLDDPPIQFFMSTEASELRFHQKIAASVSSFELLGLLGPLDAVEKPGARCNSGSFCVDVTPTSDWLAEMRAAFETVASFGEYLIFEKPDLLVILGPDYHMPAGEITTTMNGIGAGDSCTVPDPVARHMGNGGSFSGMFEPHLGWPFRHAIK